MQRPIVRIDFSGPIRPDAARIELGMAAVGLLWAVATLAVYSQLPTSAAALHLVLLGAAGGLGLAGMSEAPRGQAWLVLGVFGALPLAALDAARPAPWPLMLAAAAGALMLWWTQRQQRAWTQDLRRRADQALHAQAALEQQRQQAESQASARSRQLAEVGHELRTPMAGMLGVLALLDRNPMPTRQRHLVSLLRTSGEGLVSLLDDLLDQARLEADRLVLRPTAVDPHALAAAAVALFEPGARAKGLRLHLVLNGALPVAVRVDAQRLRQVLLNLLANALKFTDAGDVTLELSAMGHRGGEVRLTWAVQDTGIGIAAADLARVFEPFEQVCGRMGTGGTGLGLALSRRLVSAMGGELQVDSTPGHGSRFSFELALPTVERADGPPGDGRLGFALPAPAAASVPALQVQQNLVPALPPLSGRVLLAEANGLSRQLCAELLRGFGVEVLAVATPAQALAALRAGGVDLLLVDTRLPELDVARLFSAWRASHGVDITAPVPAVALSDDADDSAAARLEWPQLSEAGFAARLVRPYRAERVHALTACWLGAMPRP